ncbi:MAG: hypothetical protein HY735_02875 [Verrucomicrobia bacterium]|nr:hypothetical protein [Verrucomicrobiota bacterium]
MGLLSFLTRSTSANLLRLPHGSFTMDREGRIIASTLPQSFPQDRAREIGRTFLSFFRSAQAANLPLLEVVVDYAALRLKARALRAGAIVFLTPQSHGSKARSC